MATRIVRIQDTDRRDPRAARRTVDPAGTALMVAISGTVLAVSLMVASMSAGGVGPSPSIAQGPQPAPPPTWAGPQPGAAPASH